MINAHLLLKSYYIIINISINLCLLGTKKNYYIKKKVPQEMKVFKTTNEFHTKFSEPTFPMELPIKKKIKKKLSINIDNKYL